MRRGLMMKKQHKLTLEQNTLIDEYLSDGYKRAKSAICKVIKRRISWQEFDDKYRGVVDEAMVKAGLRYKPNKGMKFSSFAHMTIKSCMKTALRDENRDCRILNKTAESMDKPQGEDGLYLKDILVGVSDVALQDYERIKRYINTLPEDAKKVLFLRLKGYEWLEIRNRLGYSCKDMKEIMLTMQKYERIRIFREEK